MKVLRLISRTVGSTNSLRKEMTLLKNLSKMIEIDGKKYAINISKVLNFLNKYEEKERTTNEILDVYDYETKKNGSQTSKTIRELREQGTFDTNSMNFNIIYAFIIKILETPAISSDEIPIGVKIAINSMINENLIEEL